MTEIITDAEIATILGISTTDPNLSIWNEVATKILADELSTTNFVDHTVADERIKAFLSDYIVVGHFPFTELTTIKDIDFDEDTNFSDAIFYIDEGELRRVRAKNSNNERILFCKNKTYLVTYQAGYADADAVPSDLKMAVAQIVGSGLVEKDVGKGIAEKKLGEFSLKYDVQIKGFLEKSTYVGSIISKYKNYAVIC